MTKIIDLTRELTQVPNNFPAIFNPYQRILFPKIDFIDHERGASIMMQIFNCQKEDLPDGKGWGEEDITISTHLGTHVDAPWHYGPCNQDTKYPFVNQIPLEDLYSQGIVLDFSDLAGSAQLISAEMLQDKLTKFDLNQDVKAVIIYTGSSDLDICDFKYFNHPGLDADSILFLVDKGFTIIGTDAIGIDRPFLKMAQDFHKTKDKSNIWSAHFALRGLDIYILQQLSNIKQLPSHNFKICCFPLKIQNVSAAPARVVAFID